MISQSNDVLCRRPRWFLVPFSEMEPTRSAAHAPTNPGEHIAARVVVRIGFMRDGVAVLAGVGHGMFGRGIPCRRSFTMSFVTVLK